MRLVWVRSDAATVRRRLTDRGPARDAGKLAYFERFPARMRLGDPPAVLHDIMDNRLSAAVPVDDQVAALVGQAQPIG